MKLARIIKAQLSVGCKCFCIMLIVKAGYKGQLPSFIPRTVTVAVIGMPFDVKVIVTGEPTKPEFGVKVIGV